MTIAVTVLDGGDTIAARIVEYVDKAAAVAAAVAEAEAYVDTRLEAVSGVGLLPSVRAVATGNYAGTYPFTGLPGAVDGVTVAAGDVILLAGQTTGSRNGPWVVSAGVWSRPSWYATGMTIPDGDWLNVLEGTADALTAWQVTGGGVVDTNVQTWTLLHASLLTSVSDIDGATQTVQLNRRTAATWTLDNPILAAGQVGYESDTGHIKIGDGTTGWNALPYWLATLASPALTGTPTAPTAPAGTDTDQISTTAFTMAAVAAATPIVVPASLAGLTDITATVQALVNAAPAAGGQLHFQAAASTYNFAGTVTTAAGSLWTITGDGDKSELKSTAGLPIFEIGHGATGNTDGFTIRGVKLTCLVDADYASGLLVLRWMRCFDIDISLKMSGTGTGVLLDTSYVGRLRGNWRLSRYAVGVEHDGRLSPSTQQDTVSYEMTCFTPHGIILRTATTNFHGLKFSGKHVSPAPDQWTYGETVLSGGSAVGDTTVNVTDATSFAAGDPIFLDYGVNIEVNRVASTGTGTITVARPLRFAHASGQPVIKGGFSVSLSSWVRGAAFTTTHFEGVEIAVLADTPNNLTVGGAVYSSAAELTRFYGACTAVVIGQVEQGNATAVRNYIVDDDAVTSVTACWIDGPCTTTSGSSVPVSLTKSAKFPTVPTRKASVPLMSRLTANTTAVNNSTTLVDSGLSVAVEASAVYKVRAIVGYSASTAADLAAKFFGPTGATFTCTPNALRASATGTADTIQRQVRAITDTQVWGGVGVGAQVFAIVEGLLHISTTAGTFKLQFAQSAADATDALIYADSYIELQQVA